MASLRAHLQQPGEHGRLGFHADCPVCREERLFGVLSSESVVSRRAQAALATGAVAVSLAAPMAVAAQEPDSRQEGNVVPQKPSGGRDSGSPSESETPGFDPGGDTVLPFEVDAPQGAPLEGADDGAGDDGPPETEPQVDPDVRLVPPTESDDTAPSPDAESPVAPLEAEPGPVAPEAHPPATVGTPNTLETVPRQDTTPQERPGRVGAADKAGESPREPVHRSQRSNPEAGARGRTPPVDTAEPVTQASSTVQLASAQSAPDAPATAPRIPGDSRFHVVRPGESLWSIARSFLGPNASMARIAREVARLWELNEDRIGTGDPDLLRVGTRLRLP